jgi:hypothetical protein
VVAVTEPTGFDDAPARLSVTLSLALVGVATLALAAGSPTGVIAGVLGAALLGPGLLRGQRRLVDLAAAALIVGVAIVGVEGAPPVPLVVAAAATVAAWDVGENAISVGEQLGRAGDTRRAELVHAGGSVGLAGGGGGGGGAGFRLTTTTQPVTTVAVLVIAVLALTAALRL